MLTIATLSVGCASKQFWTKKTVLIVRGTLLDDICLDELWGKSNHFRWNRMQSEIDMKVGKTPSISTNLQGSYAPWWAWISSAMRLATWVYQTQLLLQLPVKFNPRYVVLLIKGRNDIVFTVCTGSHCPRAKYKPFFKWLSAWSLFLCHFSSRVFNKHACSILFHMHLLSVFNTKSNSSFHER